MKRLLVALIRAYNLAKTRRQLHALSDHMLRDIGLRREQISSGFLERVVLAEARLAQVRPGRLVAEADRRREVPAS
jgi:uncharacterized protein YjiS (DUF1127 family)